MFLNLGYTSNFDKIDSSNSVQKHGKLTRAYLKPLKSVKHLTHRKYIVGIKSLSNNNKKIKSFKALNGNLNIYF